MKSLLDIKVRCAVPRDLTAVNDIYNYYVTNSTATFDTDLKTIKEREVWFKEHKQDNLPILVALADDQIIGWASLSRYHQRCAYRQTVELSAYVAQGFTRSGVGRKLLSELLRLAEEQDHHCVLAFIEKENSASIRLFEKFNFETAGVLKEVGRKFDRYLDVTIMQKMIEQKI